MSARNWMLPGTAAALAVVGALAWYAATPGSEPAPSAGTPRYEVSGKAWQAQLVEPETPDEPRAPAPPVAADPGGAAAPRENTKGSADAPVVATVKPGAIRLRTVDARTEEPIANARVTMKLPDGYAVHYTGSDGWVEVPTDPTTEEIRTRVRVRDYATVRLELPPHAKRVVKVRPYVKVSGVLLDGETGRAVAAADLRPKGYTRQSATTDAQGRFELDRIAYGEPVAVRVIARGYPSQAVELDTKTRDRQTVTLVRLERLFGTVRDALSREPIEGVRVHAHASTVTTDEWGQFDLEVLAEMGRVEVLLVSDRYIDLSIEVKPSRRGVVLYLLEATSVEGTLRDEHGPVQGARLHARGQFGPDPGQETLAWIHELRVHGEWTLRSGFRSETRTTDDQGRFLLRGLLPGRRDIEIRAEHARLGKRKFLLEAVDTAPGGTAHVELYPGCPEEQAAAKAAAQHPIGPEYR